MHADNMDVPDIYVYVYIYILHIKMHRHMWVYICSEVEGKGDSCLRPMVLSKPAFSSAGPEAPHMAQLAQARSLPSSPPGLGPGRRTREFST